MIRPLLTASAASLSLLAACQKSEPAATEAGPIQTDAPAVAQVAANDVAVDAETPPDASSAGSSGPQDGPRGVGPRAPRGPQTLADMERRAEERFARLDADNDGVVTAAELESGGGRGGRMLARSDSDNDGRITRAEARAGTADMFRRMDANGDGVISEDERPQWGGRGGPRGLEN